jgi:DNA-binding NtrC family response regulator
MNHKKPIIWLVDDYKDMREYHSEAITNKIPNAIIKEFENISECFSEAVTPNVIVMDLSAVSPMMLGPDKMYAPIRKLLEKHSSTSLIICSAALFSGTVAEELQGICYSVSNCDIKHEKLTEEIIEIFNK